MSTLRDSCQIIILRALWWSKYCLPLKQGVKVGRFKPDAQLLFLRGIQLLGTDQLISHMNIGCGFDLLCFQTITPGIWYGLTGCPMRNRVGEIARYTAKPPGILLSMG